jgi:hypothetical protein
VIEALFMTIFDGLKTRYAAELEAVQGQYPFVPIEAKPVRLTFAGACIHRMFVVCCLLVSVQKGRGKKCSVEGAHGARHGTGRQCRPSTLCAHVPSVTFEAKPVHLTFAGACWLF